MKLPLFNQIENINDIIKSIFLLLLAISGGYVAQTLGCKTQKNINRKFVCKTHCYFNGYLLYIKCF